MKLYGKLSWRRRIALEVKSVHPRGPGGVFQPGNVRVLWADQRDYGVTPRVTLDLDAPDDPLHGQQEGHFFHGSYGDYGYLPLYIFDGDWPVLARKT